MPGVTTLHQDSETSSKPSFFRGHHWGCLSLLGQLKLMKLFDARPQDFLSAEAVVYQEKETVRYFEQARCWLRTPSGAVPSDFVSRTALANLLLANTRVLAKNPVIAPIRRRQIAPENTAGNQLARKRRAA